MEEFRIGEHFAENFKGMAPKEVKDNLEGVCYEKQEGSYTKILTQEELAERKSRLAEVSIELARIEDAKKDYMEEIKTLQTEPKASHKYLLETIKHKSERKEGTLYLIDVQEKGMMYFFDEEGVCVDARPLMPNEKQMKIQPLRKAENE